MKHLAIYLFFSLTFCLQAKEWVPEYQIIKTEEDKTLKKTEALFVITFNIGELSSASKQIIYSYNKINQKQITDKNGKIKIKVKPGNYLFKFFYNKKHVELITDSIQIKPGFRTEMSVQLRSTDMLIIAEKPVIYVYNKQKEKISIKLDLKGNFSFTYPEYNNGWNFTSNPDGTIEMNDKKYHYLFWDGKLNIETKKLNLNEGFVIDKKDLVSFFESKLTQMGLNSQEIEDYITYWCPRMSANEKNFIHFMFNAEYNNYAALTIYPKPDQLFRVYMVWAKTEETQVKEQKIESFKRGDFTVVEWGGTEINDQLILNN